MKEQDFNYIEKLIKESLVSPSDQFTDKVMDNLPERVQVSTFPIWQLVLMMVLTVAAGFLFLVSGFNISALHVFDQTLPVPGEVILMVGAAFILYTLYQFYDILQRRQDALKN